MPLKQRLLTTIGVDVGGTSLKAGLVRGARILKQDLLATSDFSSRRELLRGLTEIVRRLVRESDRPIQGIGVGIPGWVTYPEGVVRSCANLPGWREVPLRALLRRRLRLPVWVDNDVNVMTLAEWIYGAGRGSRNLVCLTLGTGVGGGLVLDGALYRGAQGSAGELGHLPIAEEGPRCSCGGKACLERYVGNRAILKSVRARLTQGATSRLLELVDARLDRLTPEIIDRACELADPLAKETWGRAGERIGLALAAVVNLLNPERIVIGGGLAKAGKWLFGPIRQTVQKRAMRGLGTVAIVPAQLGTSAGVIGAALLARQSEDRGQRSEVGLFSVFCLLFSVLCSALPAFAAEEPVVVRGDRVEYLEGYSKVMAVGNVVATYREAKLTCDEATVYLETKDAYLKGRVRLSQPDGLLKGEEVIYNFETRKGLVLRAEGEAGSWRSRGEEAQKISETAFLHREGYLTSCDFEEPHTRMQAKEVTLFLDDKVVLKRVVMYVGKVPVLFLPSYTHPLDDKRPRVTLIPGKNDQWGLFLLSAWRLYLHENLQGRVHVDYRERLDLGSGVDLKYELPVGGEGIFRTYYTHERALQRKHLWSRWYNTEKNRKLTNERERFRFQLRHRWEVDPNTRATFEYNRVKDPTVVQDFFPLEYERTQSTTSTYFQLSRLSPWYGLTFLLTKRINRFENLTQQWPQIHFDLRPIWIPWLPVWGPRLGLDQAPDHRESVGSPQSEAQARRLGTSQPGWYYQSSSDYAHFNRADSVKGTENSVFRFNTLQELFYTVRAFRWLNLRPFLGVRQTLYSRGAKKNASLIRGALSSGVDASFKVFRLFDVTTNFLGLGIHRLRHIATPTLGYRYDAKPTLSADRFIPYDGVDSLGKAKRLSPSLEHKLQTKRLENGQWRTVDLARFSSSMGYDLEGSSGRGGRWESLSLDLEVKPYRWVYIEADAGIDPHLGKFTTINADVVATPLADQHLGGTSIGQVFKGGSEELTELPWAVGMGWRYQRNASAQLVLETEFNLGKKWRVGIYQPLDVKRFITESSPTEARTVKRIYDVPEQEFRLRRDLHEWTVELVYNVRRQQGESLLLLFRLKAAPDTPFELERHYHQPKAGRNSPRR